MIAVFQFIAIGCMQPDGDQAAPDRDTLLTSDTAVVSNSVIDDDTPPSAPSEGWTRGTIAVAGAPRGVAVLGDIRAAAHDEFDRLVIEFVADILPGYNVSYLEEQPMECGSGEAISLEGEVVLEIRMEPARGYTDEGRSTLNHSPRKLGLPAAREAKVSCDFEAVFTAVIGLTRRSGLRVLTLENPTRLVIDVQH